MQQTLTRGTVIALLAMLAFSLLGAGAAFAEETQATPLQRLRDARLDVKANARLEAERLKQERLEIEATARLEMRDATTSDERRDIRDAARDARDDLKDRAADARAAFKDRLHALVRTHLGGAIARLNAAIRHFEAFVERITSRIGKLQERDIDTTSVEASLDVAVGAIADAKADVEVLSDTISSVTDASNTDEVKATIRAAIGAAKESVKEAHRALKSTIEELVSLVRASAEINTDASVDADN